MGRTLSFSDAPRYDKRQHSWVGRIGDLTVAKFSIAQPLPKNNTPAPPGLAADMLAATARILPTVRERVQAVAEPLAAHHAARWRKSGERAPSAAALARQLWLERVRLGDDGDHHLDFRALASFADHTPALWVKAGKIVDARLERPIAKNGRTIGPFDMEKLILPIGHHKPEPIPKVKKARARKTVAAAICWLTVLKAVRDGRRGAISVRGRRVVVTVAPEAGAQDGAAITLRLGQLLAELGEVLVDASFELADLYKRAWSDESNVTLSAAMIERRIRLTTINVDAVRWTLHFADAKIFGGHTIEVWRGRRGVETNLLG